MKVRFSAVVLAGLLAGCASSIPLVAISGENHVFTGSAAPGAKPGSRFTFTDGKIKCDGVFDTRPVDPNIRAQVACSNGRKGTIVAKRDSSGSSGQGTFTLDDGTSGKFIFGAGAGNF
ncbi:hypothetical protein [Hansschlegelia plantiphila]|uniref:Lipoprotein n=1 Tax=Hansschlegelia plantiphila TaxID=374655 RepID=A0A9W6MUZ4_9HYPH|nr:hypothetical protein [Hansschlegelia plantiphila]GLK67331.1 hypothetical protein GCM10008179_09690 [Hansschlegelia plantiphila]